MVVACGREGTRVACCVQTGSRSPHGSRALGLSLARDGKRNYFTDSTIFFLVPRLFVSLSLFLSPTPEQGEERMETPGEIEGFGHCFHFDT